MPPGGARLGYDHWEAFNFHVQFRNPYYYTDDPTRRIWEGYETDMETARAIAFMRERRARREPFLLMVAPHPPHPPFRRDWCPPGYLEKIPRELAWAPNVPKDHALRRSPLKARCYFAMAKNVDDNVGRLLRFLEESGLGEETIFVFTADHGEMLGSHNRMNKMVPYAESVNIPMIIRWPGHVPAGRRTGALHGPLDHMPTLCRLAGLEAPDTADGMDLSPVVLGRGGADRDALLMATYVSHWNHFQTGTRWPEWRGIKTRRHTYARWLDGREELYDNLADPHQLRDLASGRRDEKTLAWMRARLKELLAEAHDQFLPGTAYGEWYDEERNLLRTGLGPV